MINFDGKESVPEQIISWALGCVAIAAASLVSISSISFIVYSIIKEITN